jgi:hypothetical protein
MPGFGTPLLCIKVSMAALSLTSPLIHLSNWLETRPTIAPLLIRGRSTLDVMVTEFLMILLQRPGIQLYMSNCDDVTQILQTTSQHLMSGFWVKRTGIYNTHHQARQF